MAACNNCQYLDYTTSVCKVAHSKPLRNCLTPIIDSYHKLLFSGCKVLEIGCGAWSPTIEYCKSIDAIWEGIDISEFYLGKKTVATKIASVANLPFSDGYFDFVIANQSMEHWDENNVPLQRGLSEVFRVLKLGGWAFLNVPIHFHGDFLFVSGDFNKIKKQFNNYSSEIIVESWRNPSYPIPPVFNLATSFWFNKKLRLADAYLLDIKAKKQKDFVYAKMFIGNPEKLIRGLMQKGLLFYLTRIITNFMKRMA